MTVLVNLHHALESLYRYVWNDAQKQLIEQLFGQQRNADSYTEWLEASTGLDKLLGNDEWKKDPKSNLYDYQVVEYRLDQLRDARLRGDMDELLFLIRTTLERNLGNMGDPKLYINSFTGTKELIERYITECELALDTLMQSGQISDTELLSNLVQTRKSFGRTALVLSGGSTFGILHIGVMRELHRGGLLPRIISGSSAGSIFASILCIHVDEEIEELLSIPLDKESFEIFEASGQREGMMERLARFLKHGTWFDNKYLSNTMRELLGDLTFQEAYYRTRRILNVTVSSASVHEMPRLLNYLTAPNVLIWSAVCASCSVPLVFASYDILAKNPKTGEHYSWNPSTFIDGSVDNDLPLARLSEMFNVNHFIACQVNPHIVPFVRLSQTMEAFADGERPNVAWRWLWQSAQTALSNEISHYLLMTSELGLLKNTSSKFRAVLAQQYSGDITILPAIKLSELHQLFKNPSKEFFKQAEVRAARATYPQMSLIRNHCAIELALDKAIHMLRSRMIIQNTTPTSSSMALVRRSSSHTRMYHQRRKSDGLAVKYLVRRRSLQQFFGRSSRDPSPTISRKASHSNLYLHHLTPAVSNGALTRRSNSISEK